MSDVGAEFRVAQREPVKKTANRQCGLMPRGSDKTNEFREGLMLLLILRVPDQRPVSAFDGKSRRSSA